MSDKSPEEEANSGSKHRLNDQWTLWYDNPSVKMSLNTWGSQRKEIYTFDSVEDFWSLWNNIKNADELKVGSSYYLFKKGIAPDWDDPENSKGGKWVIGLQVSDRAKRLKDLWLHSVLAVIGSSLEDYEEVCGVVVSLRKNGDKISFWTKNGHKAETCKRIGLGLKQILAVEDSIVYQLHDDSKSQGSTYGVTARYQV